MAVYAPRHAVNVAIEDTGRASGGERVLCNLWGAMRAHRRLCDIGDLVFGGRLLIKAFLLGLHLRAFNLRNRYFNVEPVVHRGFNSVLPT